MHELTERIIDAIPDIDKYIVLAGDDKYTYPEFDSFGEWRELLKIQIDAVVKEYEATHDNAT